MKTIGVIGGMSPQATMDFEARVHEISQRLIPQRFNSGYPPMVVYYHRSPPFITGENGLPLQPFQPDPHFAEAVSKLGTMADFLVITGNAPYLMQGVIEETTGLKVLNMIDLAVDEVKRRGWRRVGVVGLSEPVVYLRRLDAAGLPYESLSGEAGGLRERLDHAIVALMEGKTGPEGTALAMQAVDEMRARGVDGVILGCTEIPLLMGETARASDLVDPIELLAEAAVRFAIEE